MDDLSSIAQWLDRASNRHLEGHGFDSRWGAQNIFQSISTWAEHFFIYSSWSNTPCCLYRNVRKGDAQLSAFLCKTIYLNYSHLFLRALIFAIFLTIEKNSRNQITAKKRCRENWKRQYPIDTVIFAKYIFGTGFLNKQAVICWQNKTLLNCALFVWSEYNQRW